MKANVESMRRLVGPADRVPWLEKRDYEEAKRLAELGLLIVCHHPDGGRLAYPTLRGFELLDKAKP